MLMPLAASLAIHKRGIVVCSFFISIHTGIGSGVCNNFPDWHEDIFNILRPAYLFPLTGCATVGTTLNRPLRQNRQSLRSCIQSQHVSHDDTLLPMRTPVRCRACTFFRMPGRAQH
jgi:hypothetical protein